VSHLTHYRPNVGIVVFNSKGFVLGGERLDNLGSWQYPQGGIDEGEDPLSAMRRELFEETGIHKFELIAESPEWLTYDFPAWLKIKGMTDRYRGQKQKWYLVHIDDASQIDLQTHTPEFARVEFMAMAEMTNQIIEFKKKIYIQLEALFLPAMEQFLRG